MELGGEGDEGLRLRCAEEGQTVEPGAGVLEVFGGLADCAGEESLKLALLPFARENMNVELEVKVCERS